MEWGEMEHLLFSDGASRTVLVYTGRGSASLHSLLPWKVGKAKQLHLDCGRISSGLVRGWKHFLDPAEETQQTFWL